MFRDHGVLRGSPLSGTLSPDIEPTTKDLSWDFACGGAPSAGATHVHVRATSRPRSNSSSGRSGQTTPGGSPDLESDNSLASKQLPHFFDQPYPSPDMLLAASPTSPVTASSTSGSLGSTSSGVSATSREPWMSHMQQTGWSGVNGSSNLQLDIRNLASFSPYPRHLDVEPLVKSRTHASLIASSTSVSGVHAVDQLPFNARPRIAVCADVRVKREPRLGAASSSECKQQQQQQPARHQSPLARRLRKRSPAQLRAMREQQAHEDNEDEDDEDEEAQQQADEHQDEVRDTTTRSTGSEDTSTAAAPQRSRKRKKSAGKARRGKRTKTDRLQQQRTARAIMAEHFSTLYSMCNPGAPPLSEVRVLRGKNSTNSQEGIITNAKRRIQQLRKSYQAMCRRAKACGVSSSNGNSSTTTQRSRSRRSRSRSSPRKSSVSRRQQHQKVLLAPPTTTLACPVTAWTVPCCTCTLDGLIIERNVHLDQVLHPNRPPRRLRRKKLEHILSKAPCLERHWKLVVELAASPTPSTRGVRSSALVHGNKMEIMTWLALSGSGPPAQRQQVAVSIFLDSAVM